MQIDNSPGVFLIKTQEEEEEEAAKINQTDLVCLIQSLHPGLWHRAGVRFRGKEEKHQMPPSISTSSRRAVCCCVVRVCVCEREGCRAVGASRCSAVCCWDGWMSSLLDGGVDLRGGVRLCVCVCVCNEK